MTSRFRFLGDLHGGGFTILTCSSSESRHEKLVNPSSILKSLVVILATAVLTILTSPNFSEVAKAESNKQHYYHAFSSPDVVSNLQKYLKTVAYQGSAEPMDGAVLKSGHPPTDPVAALQGYARKAGLPISQSAGKDNSKKQKSETSGTDVIQLAAATSGAADATYVGSDKCMGCHADAAAVFDRTLMGRIGKTQPGTMECENCHGPGSEHVKAGGGRGVGGIISFRPDDFSRTPKQNNAICLGCHDKGHRVLWKGSTHETRNLSCTNCHTVMKDVSRKHQLKKSTEIETCAQCHKNKRAQFWRSTHMPVVEGKMSCTSCHNPHGSFGQSLLKEASVNENCYKCHAEKRGPFLFEHAPVRENCLNCHNPHGSNNDFMLNVSRPRLCQQCHSGGYHPSNPRDPGSVYALNRSCQHCHVRHHGSNSAAGQRFQR